MMSASLTARGAILALVLASVQRFARLLIRCRAGTEAPTEADELIATITDPNVTTCATASMYTPEQGTWTFRA